MLSQVFYVLLFYVIGEVVSYLINGFVPGSVIGMLLLFTALCFKVINGEKVNKLSKALTDNMGFFFLPAAVGLMSAFDVLSKYWLVILISTTVSTILVIIAVALVQQRMGKEDKNG